MRSKPTGCRFFPVKSACSIILLAAFIAGSAAFDLLFAQSAPVDITCVQANYAAPNSARTITVPFTQTQTAGDLDVVVVAWESTSTVVASVTDLSGNVYNLAVGPTQVTGYVSQSIYYAKSIAPAKPLDNAVTVRFASSVSQPEVRILEYNGADPSNPVDVVAAGSGDGTASVTGSATTTNAADLIFASNAVRTFTTGVESGFTDLMITSPHGDLAEEETAVAAGSYSATATLRSPGRWVMQMVAFRNPIVGSGEPGTLSLSPATLSFGEVTVGGSSVLPLVVTNTGSASVTISSVTISGAGFSFTGPALPLTLASGGNTSFTVAFDPATATGDTTGAFSAVSNASNSPTVASLTADGVNQHSVALSWTASASSGVAGYNIYRGAVSGGPYTKLNSSLIAGTTYADSTVQAGQTYYYVTTALTTQGIESADSNQATAVVPSP